MLARRVTAANEVSELAGAGRLQFLGRPQQTVLKGDWRFPIAEQKRATGAVGAQVLVVVAVG